MGSIKYTNAQFYSRFPLLWSDGPLKILGIYIDNDINKMMELNYNTMFDKFNNVCMMWQGRSLTPIGKIQIVNSLMNSLLIYKIRALPSPSQKTLVHLKRIVTSFIWEGKVPKVSYPRLIASFPNGGLQLRDPFIINQSIKLAQVAKIIDDQLSTKHIWKTWYNTHFSVTPNYLFNCNLSAKDVRIIYPPSYFIEILAYWAERNFHEPQNVNEILQQHLWYNSFIKKDKKPLFSKELYSLNVKKLIDIFDLDTGTFYTYDELIRLYPDSIDFLSYHSIISCIPKKWRGILKINAPSASDNAPWLQEYQCLCKRAKPSVSMYKFIREHRALDNSTLLILWNNDLRQKIQIKTFQKLFIDIRKLTVSTKLRYFLQYRILVRALTLNIHVSKWNKDVSSKCSFCNLKEETTIHFFVECSYSKKMWIALQKWIKHWYNINVEFTPSMIILGNYNQRDKDLVNMFILITKFYLYKCRVQKISANFVTLIADIDRIRETEKVIANKQGKQVLHNIKWQK